MRILIVNEFIDERGAEEVAKKQFAALEEHGVSVHMLAFQDSHGASQRNPEKYTIVEIPRFYKLIFSLRYYFKIRRVIKEFRPDYILVHNVFSSPFTVYRAFKDYQTIQTVHDYKIVCPTAMCIREDDGEVCAGYGTRECMRHCGANKNTIKFRIQEHIVRRTETIRKKYVKTFIAPSQKLKEYMTSYGYDVTCINNPIESLKQPMQPHIVDNEQVKFVYAGAICKEKGIISFLEYLKSRNEGFVVDVYGEITDDTNTENLANIANIHFKGKIPHAQLIEILDQYDYMIVPSMWQENYPTSILEAMRCGVVVIGSDRGGIPEMLSNHRGYVFSYGDIADLCSTMDEVFASSREKYESIRQEAYHYVCTNNSVENYYQKLMEVIQHINSTQKEGHR